jgi:hypothetical protein
MARKMNKIIRVPRWGRSIEHIELDDNDPRLITTGCSFASRPFDSFKYAEAFEDVDALSWSDNLSEKMNRISLDWSKIGSGCGYAYRIIIDSVLENLGSDMIVVVGWSSIGRWETFTNFDTKFREELLIDMRKSEEVNIHKFFGQRKYKQHSLNYTYFQDHLEKLNYIISLANFLENLNIKYLFFNAFEPLDGWKSGTGYYSPSETGKDCPILSRATEYIKNNTNWLDRIQIELGAKEEYFNDVITGTFDNPPGDPLRTNLEYFLPNDGWHPSPLAHREWSEILYNEICNRY